MDKKITATISFPKEGASGNYVSGTVHKTGGRYFTLKNCQNSDGGIKRENCYYWIEIDSSALKDSEGVEVESEEKERSQEGYETSPAIDRQSGIATASVRVYVTANVTALDPNYMGYIETMISLMNTGLQNSNTLLRVEAACVEVTNKTFNFSSTLEDTITIKGNFLCFFDSFIS